jgi:DNA polymerase
MGKKEKMRQIRDGVVELVNSPLYEYRQEMEYVPVIGQGSHEAKLVLVGEAPGENEAQTGIPFSGRAGELFDKLMEEVGIKREEIYITNVLKDRPQDNRTPTAEEINLYGPFLIRQIEIIDPQLIATLGKVATEFVFKHYGLGDKLGPMKEMHGKVYETQSLFETIKLLPMYHPAVALHNPRLKDVIEDDFVKLKEVFVG